MFHREFLAYQHSGEIPTLGETSQGIEWKIIGQDDIPRYFRADSRRMDTFRRFLGLGFIGLLLSRGDEWVTYGWMTTPQTVEPPHLPPAIRHLGAYWIFFCRTHEHFQGHGYYKYLLGLLVQRACECSQGVFPLVGVDTTVDNIPSRKAILSAGFLESGVVFCRTFPSPAGGLLTWGGEWRKRVPHPSV